MLATVGLLCTYAAALLGTTDPSSSVYNVLTYGAKGDGTTDDSAAIAATVKAAVAGGTVLFPSEKTFLTKPFNITSGITLEVDGTIKGVTGNNTADGANFIRNGGWARLPPLPSFGTDRDTGGNHRLQALIFAVNAENVAIKGAGTIDGQGPWWWDQHSSKSKNKTLPGGVGRPHLIEFYNCSKVEVTGVTLRDSPFWTLHPVYCSDVWIHHITIRARMYAPNTDGIDPDSSRNVLVEFCDISTGDDHIAIKSGMGSFARDAFPLYLTENVTVRYNTLHTGMGISIGSETSGGMKDIVVHSNTLGLCDSNYSAPNACGWGAGLHLKTTLDRGGIIENIEYRNNTVLNGSYINVETNYQSSPKMPVGYPPTVIRNVAFIGNTGARGGVSFNCAANSTCKNVTMKNNEANQHGGGGGGGNPWHCKFIQTYTVAGNSPPGAESCMEHSMNRTKIEEERKTNNVTVQAENLFNLARGHMPLKLPSLANFS